MKVIILIFLFYNILFLLSQNLYDGITIDFTPLSIEEEKIFYEEYTPIIIPEYFLLGTLNVNKMGRFADGLKENQVDYYEDYEEPVVSFVENYVQEHFNVKVLLKKEDEKINLYSLELANRMQIYFDKEGLLNMHLFDSKEKIYSFLLGSYYRKGFRVNENTYMILRHYNNPIYFLLKEAECSKILFLSTKYAIPGTILFYFEPSLRLKKYFSTMESEKAKLNISQYEIAWPKDGREKAIKEVFDYFGE